MVRDHSGQDDGSHAKVLSGNLFDLRLRDCREIRRFGSNDPLKSFRVMGFQVLAQKLGRTALSHCVTDKDD
jgi:hypothetical protein